MKNLKSLLTLLGLALIFTFTHICASAQSAEDKNKFANITASGLSIRWEIAAQHSGLVMTISMPDGQVVRKEFKAGSSPEFTLTDKDGSRLPDGQYKYELRLTPEISSDVKKALKEGREKLTDDDAVTERELRKRGLLSSQPLIQSGTFQILRGSVIVAGATEAEAGRPSAKKRTDLRELSPAYSAGRSEDFSGQEASFILARAVETFAPRSNGKMTGQPFAHPAFPDQVIPDDLIVQGSACIGLDCVNNETFNFDSIRIKENNTRIAFVDTSTSASFPTRDWRIRANSSDSGGLSAFFIDDMGNASTGAEPVSSTPLTLEAGAPTNSIYVDSTGRLGLRTSTPVLDIHANTSNTPAFRMEQNNSGGFTAQTWDIAGNEANFFIRDVTGGSRLPFRIRPGAPTSSIDISASGNIGIGTASPTTLFTSDKVVHISSASNPHLRVTDTTNTVNTFLDAEDSAGNVGTASNHNFGIFSNNVARITVQSGGNVGVGTASPDQKFSVNGDASKIGGGSWQVFSDERLKNIKGQFTSGLSAVMQLQPIRYEYRRNNALGLVSEGEHVGFGAQALQKIIPEAVTKTANGYLLVNNDPIIWTMLNAIKEQQKEIEQLKAQIRELQPSAGASNKPRQRRR
jgi:hypothetical protein